MANDNMKLDLGVIDTHFPVICRLITQSALDTANVAVSAIKKLEDAQGEANGLTEAMMDAGKGWQSTFNSLHENIMVEFKMACEAVPELKAALDKFAANTNQVKSNQFEKVKSGIGLNL